MRPCHPSPPAARLPAPLLPLLPQVERVLGVYQEQGEEGLESYRVPLLSWEEVKALKGPDTVGLPLGSEGEGRAGLRACAAGCAAGHACLPSGAAPFCVGLLRLLGAAWALWEQGGCRLCPGCQSWGAVVSAPEPSKAWSSVRPPRHALVPCSLWRHAGRSGHGGREGQKGRCSGAASGLRQCGRDCWRSPGPRPGHRRCAARGGGRRWGGRYWRRGR